MIYLLLFIILSSTVTLMFKITGKLGLNDDNLIVVNYLVASTVSVSLWLASRAHVRVAVHDVLSSHS